MRAGELGINFWQIQNRSKSGKEAQVLSILTFNDLQMTPFKIKFLTLVLAKIFMTQLPLTLVPELQEGEGSIGNVISRLGNPAWQLGDHWLEFCECSKFVACHFRLFRPKIFGNIQILSFSSFSLSWDFPQEIENFESLTDQGWFTLEVGISSRESSPTRSSHLLCNCPDPGLLMCLNSLSQILRFLGSPAN